MAEDVVNLGGLREIAGDDTEFVKDVILQYSERGAQLVRAIQTAHKSGAEDDLACFAHALKGSSRAVGAVMLGSVCEKIEFAARESRVDSAESLIIELPEMWSQTAQELQKAI